MKKIILIFFLLFSVTTFSQTITTNRIVYEKMVAPLLRFQPILDSLISIINQYGGTADTVHYHTIDHIIALTDTLLNRAYKIHTHTQAQIQGLIDTLNNRAYFFHGHNNYLVNTPNDWVNFGEEPVLEDADRFLFEDESDFFFPFTKKYIPWLRIKNNYQDYADSKISNTPYDATSWNGVTTIAPSKNAVRDKFLEIQGGGYAIGALWTEWDVYTTESSAAFNEFSEGVILMTEGTADELVMEFDGLAISGKEFSVYAFDIDNSFNTVLQTTSFTFIVSGADVGNTITLTSTDNGNYYSFKFDTNTGTFIQLYPDRKLLAITGFTNELAQDAVGGMINTSLTYVDGTPLLHISDSDKGDVTVSSSGTSWQVDNDSHDHATTITGKSANVSDADFGDVSIASGVWSVEDNSHAHSNVSDGDKGDITVTSGTWTTDNDAITYAKIQNVTDVRLLGRSAGSSGDVQEITVGSGLSLSAGSLTATGGTPPTGVFDDLQISILQGDGNLAEASGVQTWAGSDRTTQDVFTVTAKTTYIVEGEWYVNTGATIHTTAMAWSTAATITDFQYQVILWSAAANTIATTASHTHVTGVANKVLNATSTAVYTIIQFKGTIVVGSVAAGSTITPQINFSANPTGTCLMKRGSWISFTKIGTDTDILKGGWN